MLKLAKLPDRTPVKIGIAVTPDLARALADYAALYSQTYGKDEPVAQLVPAMLTAFLEGDRAFAKRRKNSDEEIARSQMPPLVVRETPSPA